MRNYRETSREAWDSMVGVNAHVDRLILRTLDRAGPDGLIAEDLAQRADLKIQTTTGNLRHLVERGLAFPTGERGKTSSGRSAMKWRSITHQPQEKRQKELFR